MNRDQLTYALVTKPNKRLAKAKRPRGGTNDVRELTLARTAGVGLGMRGKAVTARKIDPRLAAVRELLRAIGSEQRSSTAPLMAYIRKVSSEGMR